MIVKLKTELCNLNLDFKTLYITQKYINYYTSINLIIRFG